MFGSTRWSPFDEIFNIQRAVDRLFNDFWSDLPTRPAAASSGAFQVNTTDEGWRIDVPLPGIDPEHVALEVAGNTLHIRVEEPDTQKKGSTITRHEHTLTLPQFLDIEHLRATNRFGMLQLTVPLKESVRPRRVQIENVDRKQLTAA